VHIDYIPPEVCAAATESVVVIDVWRSFSLTLRWWLNDARGPWWWGAVTEPG